jgi:phosphatidylserine decarboxylase
VIIGATCTGSIKTLARPGIHRKGSQFGTFGFGGSTVIMIIDSTKISFAPDLLKNSKKHKKETLVKMGQLLGYYKQMKMKL